MKPIGSGVVLLMAVCALTACASGFRGAPAPPFPLKRIESSSPFNDPQAMLTDLSEACDVAQRNRYMVPIIALIDIRYADFRHKLAANKKHSSAITSALLLAADVAGGLTSSIGVKDNYLAFSALLSGGELIYDKNYMYENTVTALVTQMDANRAGTLLKIREAMLSRTFEQYPPEVAINDLIQYYHAGTLLGAITAVQTKAGAEANEKTEALRVLEDKSLESIAATRIATKRMDRMIAGLDAAQTAALKKYLQGQGITLSDTPSKIELVSALRQARKKHFPADFSAFEESLEDAGLIVPPAEQGD